MRETYDPAVYKNATRRGATTRVFSSNIPHRAPAICYIAGIECPIQSVSVSYGVWQIPEASITMFPDPLLQGLGREDRVPVVIFYLDEYIDPDRPTWRMLFEGEITGWGYSNTAAGRAVRFDCVGDIAIYTQLFFFYMSTVSGVVQGTVEQPMQPAGANFVTPIFPYALFHKGLVPSDKPGDIITRPYDLAYNIVRGLTSERVNPKARSLPMYNFFSRWVRRQQFHNKWVALPFLDEMYEDNGSGGLQKRADQPPGIFPILRAVKSQEALQALQKVGQDYSGANVFTWLKMVLDTVYMELAMLPTPAAVSCLTNGHISEPPRTLSFDEIRAKISAKIRERTQNNLAADLSGVPSKLPTKLSEVPKPWLLDPKKPIRLTNYFVKPQMFFGLPPTCNVVFPSMDSQLEYNENYVTQPTRLYVEDNNLASLVAGKQVSEEMSKLITNVLARGYPPPIDRIYRERVLGQDAARTGKNLLIYPEEFFKGPVTSRVQAPNWFMHYANTVNANGHGSSAPDAKSVAPANGSSLTDQDVYLLYAQYEYYRQRYGQRTGSVQCSFQPYVVPGFPMVAFDDFQSRLHTIGYLMRANQTITAMGLNTTLQFSYGRTIYEFLEDIANEIDNPALQSRKGLATAAAPPEPIPEIRDIVQHEYKCDQFYQALFHQRLDKDTASKKRKPAVFRARDILAFVKADGKLDDITIEGKNEERITTDTKNLTKAKAYLQKIKERGPGGLADGTASPEEMQQFVWAVDIASDNNVSEFGGYQQVAEDMIDITIGGEPALQVQNEYERLLLTVDSRLNDLENPQTNHNLAGAAQRELTPKPGFEPLFDSYDAAMKYCSRPICTLEEYILFIGGTAEGPQDDVAYRNSGGKPSARYYTRIRTLTGATDATNVTAAQQGFSSSDSGQPKAKPAGPATATGGAATGGGQEGLLSEIKPTPEIQPVEPGEAVPTNFPQMRAEWDKVLLRYRRNVYSAVKVQR